MPVCFLMRETERERKVADLGGWGAGMSWGRENCNQNILFEKIIKIRLSLDLLACTNGD